MAMHSATAQQIFQNACESVEPTTHSMYNVYVSVSIDDADADNSESIFDVQICNGTVVHSRVNWVFPTTIFNEVTYANMPMPE
jgi:hypothetical protein